MRWIRTSALAAAIVSAACAAGHEEPRSSSIAPSAAHEIAYHLTPVVDESGLTALDVAIDVAADPSGTTVVRLPTQWAGEEALWRFVSRVRVDGSRAVEQPDEATRVIAADPGTSLTIRYRVSSAYDHDPRADERQPFAPVIRPTWFHAFGHALFAVVGDRFDAPVSFSWHGVAMPVATDLEHIAEHGGTVGDMLDAVVVGGPALRVRTTEIRSARIRIAIVGELELSTDPLVTLVQRVITAERDFWDDHGAPFLVCVAPLQAVAGRGALAGTGLGDAFTVMLSTDTPLEPLRHLLAHEYFHTWNADRIGGHPAGDGLAGQWFTEGFTEYYTWRLLLRAGIYDLSDFVDEWNAALVEYAASPAKTASNQRIVEGFWSDADVAMLPYRRGALLAARWEQRLHDATDGTRSLDDVLRRMQSDVARGVVAHDGPHAADLFAAAYRDVGGPDLHEDLATFVERGDVITLAENAFGPCVRVVTAEREHPRTGARVVAQQLELVEPMTPAQRTACVSAVR